MKVWRWFVLLLLVSTAVIFTSGCWDEVETEKTDFVLGLGVDPAPGGNYSVTLSIPSAVATSAGGAAGGGGALTGLHVTGEGESFLAALKDAENQLEFKVYLGQLMLVAVSEDIARRGLMPIWDALLREHYISARLIMVVTAGPARDLFDVTPAEEPLAAMAMWDTVNSLAQRGEAPISFLFKNVADYFDPGVDPVVVMLEAVPAVQTTGGSPPGKGGGGSSGSGSGGEQSEDMSKSSVTYRYDGLAIFHGDKMVGKLDQRQGMSATLLIGGHGGQRCDVTLDQGKATVEVSRVRRSYQYRVQDGRVYIDVGLSMLVKVPESTTSLNFMDPDNISRFTAQANQHFAKVIADAVALTQALQADIFGLGLRMQAQDYRDFIKLDWDQAYKDAVINIHVNTLVLEQGRWRGAKGP